AKKTESKPVAKKTSGTKKPAVKKETNVEAKKVEEVKVVETKAALVGISKTESKYVIKKHYEQVSKKDLLVKLEEKHSDLSKKAVKKIVDSAFEIMSETLFKNEEIMISNFGKLEKIHKEQKQGKNPSTGEIITIPASNSVKFKANKHLKELMTKTKWTGLKRVKKEVKK
ncbi:HU family DNA-binding protein, partial [Mesoplasma chauliocola]